jgi:hypothetical protein
MIPQVSNPNEAVSAILAGSAPQPYAFPSALKAALAEQDAATLRLRREVCRYIAERKADGWAPEVVFAAMRAVARQLVAASQVDAETRHASDPRTTEALVALLTQWCVAAYYRAD